VRSAIDTVLRGQNRHPWPRSVGPVIPHMLPSFVPTALKLFLKPCFQDWPRCEFCLRHCAGQRIYMKDEAMNEVVLRSWSGKTDHLGPRLRRAQPPAISWEDVNLQPLWYWTWRIDIFCCQHKALGPSRNLGDFQRRRTVLTLEHSRRVGTVWQWVTRNEVARTQTLNATCGLFAQNKCASHQELCNDRSGVIEDALRTKTFKKRSDSRHVQTDHLSFHKSFRGKMPVLSLACVPQGTGHTSSADK